jgi:hypothetical protein
MRKFLILLPVALVLVAAGCGSSETKTVTETAAGKTSEEAESGEEAASEGESAAGRPTATTIPDGTWKRGEYTEGTYRAPGGSSCWWEKLNELGEEVFEPGRYGSEETNILVDIDSRYFKTEECGTWEKVG